MQPATPRDAFPYVCQIDRDEAEQDQTVFTLKPPSFSERKEAQGQIRLDATTNEIRNYHGYRAVVLRLGIRKVERFEGPLEWAVDRSLRSAGKRPVLTEESLSQFPEDVLDELLSALESGGNLTEDEGKA